MRAARLELLRILAQGGQSDVYVGRCNGQLQVAKYFKDPLDAAQEASCLKRLHHSGIIRLIGTSKALEHPFLVLEYVSGTTLRLMIDHTQDNSGSINFNILLHICHCLLESVRYIHSQGIIHGDLSPANLLIGQRGEIKLCDFAMALLPWQRRLGPPFGKLDYMAPELLREHPPSIVSDYYAIAIIISELCSKLFIEQKYSRNIVFKRLHDSNPSLCQWLKAALKTSPAFRPKKLPPLFFNNGDLAKGRRQLSTLIAKIPIKLSHTDSMIHKLVSFTPRGQ